MEEASEVSDFQFHALRRIRVFSSGSLKAQKYGLQKNCPVWISVSSTFGIVVVANPNGDLLSLNTSDLHTLTPNTTNLAIEVTDLVRKVTPFKENMPVKLLETNCDGRILAIVADKPNAGPFVFLYDFRLFSPEYKGDVLPYCEIRLSSNCESICMDLQWNPTLSTTFSACCDDGTLTTVALNAVDSSKYSIVGVTTLKNNRPCCLCWSPKGKQLMVGMDDGRLCQFRPELAIVRSIPAPSSSDTQLTEGPLHCAGLCWLSTPEIAVAYAQSNSSVSLTLLRIHKERPPVWINFNDVCFGFVDRSPLSVVYRFRPIFHWNVLLCSSSCACELGVIGKNDDWRCWIMDDNRRAELPVDGHQKETWPIGVVLDLSNTIPVSMDAEGVLIKPPMPVLLILTTDGLIVPYTVVNAKDSAPILTSSVHQFTLPIVVDTPKELSSLTKTQIRPMKSELIKSTDNDDKKQELQALRRFVADEKRKLRDNLNNTEQRLKMPVESIGQSVEHESRLVHSRCETMNMLQLMVGEVAESVSTAQNAIREVFLCTQFQSMEMDQLHSQSYRIMLKHRPLDPESAKDMRELKRTFEDLQLQIADLQNRLFEQKLQMRKSKYDRDRILGTNVTLNEHQLISHTLINVQTAANKAALKLHSLGLDLRTFRNQSKQQLSSEWSSVASHSKSALNHSPIHSRRLSNEQNCRIRQLLSSHPGPLAHVSTIPKLEPPAFRLRHFETERNDINSVLMNKSFSDDCTQTAGIQRSSLGTQTVTTEKTQLTTLKETLEKKTPKIVPTTKSTPPLPIAAISTTNTPQGSTSLAQFEARKSTETQNIKPEIGKKQPDVTPLVIGTTSSPFTSTEGMSTFISCTPAVTEHAVKMTTASSLATTTSSVATTQSSLATTQSSLATTQSSVATTQSSVATTATTTATVKNTTPSSVPTSTVSGFNFGALTLSSDKSSTTTTTNSTKSIFSSLASNIPVSAGPPSAFAGIGTGSQSSTFGGGSTKAAGGGGFSVFSTSASAELTAAADDSMQISNSQSSFSNIAATSQSRFSTLDARPNSTFGGGISGSAFGSGGAISGSAFGSGGGTPGSAFGSGGAISGSPFGSGGAISGSAFRSGGAISGSPFGSGGSTPGSAFGSGAVTSGSAFGSGAVTSGSAFGSCAVTSGSAFGSKATFGASSPLRSAVGISANQFNFSANSNLQTAGGFSSMLSALPLSLFFVFRFASSTTGFGALAASSVDGPGTMTGFGALAQQNPGTGSVFGGTAAPIGGGGIGFGTGSSFSSWRS